MTTKTGKKRGRPALPVALHLLAGTFRPDRHGPRPKPGTAQSVPSATPPAAVTSIADSGLTFVAAVRAQWQIDDALGRVYARAAGIALDRCVALDGLLDGPAGLLARLAAGEKAVSAKAVETLLKAQRQAHDHFLAAVDRLELDVTAGAQPQHEAAS